MLFWIFTWVLACTPTCEQTCYKLLSCEEIATPSNEKECTSACNVQELLYDDWEDETKREAFSELKSCIYGETCQTISDGGCYEGAEDLFLF